MKITLKNFPFRGKSSDYPRSDLKTALEWKEAFEKELLEELELEKKNMAPKGFFPNAANGSVLTIMDILGLDFIVKEGSTQQ